LALKWSPNAFTIVLMSSGFRCHYEEDLTKTDDLMGFFNQQ